MNEDIENKFATAQQELVDKFKEKMKAVADDVLCDLYCDVTPNAVLDAHVNFKNALWDEVREEFKKEILHEYSYYSRAHTLRMDLLKNHKEDLQNKIIEDLQAKIERMSQEIKQLHSRY